MVPSDLLLSKVDGVMNGIVVRGNAIGDVMFYGAGAGKLPTASAGAADVIDAVKHDHARKLISWEEGEVSMMFSPSEIKSRWFIRAKSANGMLAGDRGSLFDFGLDNDNTYHNTTCQNTYEYAEFAAVTREEYSPSELKEALRDTEVISQYRMLA